MDDPQVERFFERLQEDKALNEEYRSALAAAIDTAVAATIREVARRHGFRFSAEAARAHLQPKVAELDDAQLDAVVGGVGGSFTGASSPGSSFGSRSLLSSNPWMLGGIVAAAIAVPLATDRDDAS